MKNLFTERKIYDVSNNDINAIEARAKNLSRKDFENSTIEELTKTIKDEFELFVPELSKDEIYTKQPKDIKIRTNRRPVYGGGILNIDGTEFVFVIPFKGDYYHFGITPSRFLSIFPYGNASSNKIEINYEVPNNSDSSGLRAQFDKNLSIIEQYLGFLDADFKQFNGQLGNSIKIFIERRKAKLDSDDNTASGFGFPVK